MCQRHAGRTLVTTPVVPCQSRSKVCMLAARPGRCCMPMCSVQTLLQADRATTHACTPTCASSTVRKSSLPRPERKRPPAGAPYCGRVANGGWHAWARQQRGLSQQCSPVRQQPCLPQQVAATASPHLPTSTAMLRQPATKTSNQLTVLQAERVPHLRGSRADIVHNVVAKHQGVLQGALCLQPGHSISGGHAGAEQCSGQLQ